MTVRELIAELQKISDQDRIVILQRDPEGNGYEPLCGIWSTSLWNPRDKEATIEKLTPELRDKGFSEEDVRGTVPCLVLQP